MSRPWIQGQISIALACPLCSLMMFFVSVVAQNSKVYTHTQDGEGEEKEWGRETEPSLDSFYSLCLLLKVLPIIGISGK